ncbi:MAG TPA: hypothetical protein VFI77_07340, partial [Gemmatimonadales bacterium]|nr:hypothetical protein [Gemmatimonadales bacterium]
MTPSAVESLADVDASPGEEPESLARQPETETLSEPRAAFQQEAAPYAPPLDMSTVERVELAAEASGQIDEQARQATAGGPVQDR